jgi:uncharacterized membrane protein YdjX (TVP38/TMEM64 family)
MLQKNKILKSLSDYTKKGLLILWIFSIIWVGGYYLYNPGFFQGESLKIFFQSFGSYLLVAYFLICILRGLTLVPSLPFVIVGMLLFPENLYFVYIISMIGIIGSAAMIYFFSVEMDFDALLEKKYPKSIIYTKKQVQKYGFWAVLFWSFFILVPTDVICYIAGVTRMNFYKFIWAVTLWEWFICIIIIFYDKTLFGFV